jgi:hypothetical protein
VEEKSAALGGGVFSMVIGNSALKSVVKAKIGLTFHGFLQKKNLLPVYPPGRNVGLALDWQIAKKIYG